ncbi:TetR/AcrR family transcriptional regulator [Marihabitans asiaticum]|uniref:TetR family transcriptional regulator n=1 Tax=Marihabitans asiaticum TaxID=415218 RepID=A0A560WIC4_9MICO|nr:TetR family transcriptional regulator C-terminal domain-containing protein [Marihabitans asiaticum]TWD17264.1 TetR family transcriptional regulator [Marihabitans asiaticum]
MPKIVDHDQRRADIATAFATVARRDGVAAASVRTVAAEAGLSPGALRHYFDSQAGLVLFVAERLIGTAERRTRAAIAAAEGPEGRLQALEQLLPLDDARRAEFDVWHAVVVGARGDARLAALNETSWQGIDRVCRWVLTETGVDAPRLDAETARLHVLTDGLALHLSLNPDRMTPALARAVLRDHVAALAGS